MGLMYEVVVEYVGGWYSDAVSSLLSLNDLSVYDCVVCVCV